MAKQFVSREICDLCPSPIVSFLKDGTLVYANTAAEILLLLWNVKVGKKLKKGQWAVIKAAIKQGREIEISLAAADTQSILSGSVFGTDEYLHLIFQDVSRYQENINHANKKIEALNKDIVMHIQEETLEMRQQNEELLHERDAAERANRLKSEFLANMSHELRTPLNSIIGFSDVMLQGIDGELNDAQTVDIELINGSGKHLLSLINTILDIAKVESGKMEVYIEEVNVAEAVDSVIQLSQVLLKKKPVKLLAKFSGITKIQTDQMKLKQILLNLLSNAIKFTDEGSVTILVTKVKDQVCFEVKDTGIGIKKQDIPKVFERFQQVDGQSERAKSGTGLGMALVSELVKLQGGRIWATSKVGKGSSFFITLPIHPSKEPSAVLPGNVGIEKLTPKLEAAGGLHQIQRVLVVDDEPSNCQLISRYLEKEGYQVRSIYSAEHIDKELDTFQPQAIILDILLPEKDGWQVLREIKGSRKYKSIPVILSSILENRELGFSFGATDYLVKPFGKGDLLSAISKLESNSKKILIIDDSPLDRELLIRMLQELTNVQLVTAGTGKEGLKLAAETHPDLVIVDLLLPDIDGFEVLKKLKATQRDLPAIVISAKFLSQMEESKLKKSTEKLFQKGLFTRKDLLTEITDVLKKYSK